MDSQYDPVIHEWLMDIYRLKSELFDKADSILRRPCKEVSLEEFRDINKVILSIQKITKPASKMPRGNPSIDEIMRLGRECDAKVNEVGAHFGIIISTGLFAVAGLADACKPHHLSYVSVSYKISLAFFISSFGLAFLSVEVQSPMLFIISFLVLLVSSIFIGLDHGVFPFFGGSGLFMIIIGYAMFIGHGSLGSMWLLGAVALIIVAFLVSGAIMMYDFVSGESMGRGSYIRESKEQDGQTADSRVGNTTSPVSPDAGGVEEHQESAPQFSLPVQRARRWANVVDIGGWMLRMFVIVLIVGVLGSVVMSLHSLREMPAYVEIFLLFFTAWMVLGAFLGAFGNMMQMRISMKASAKDANAKKYYYNLQIAMLYRLFGKNTRAKARIIRFRKRVLISGAVVLAAVVIGVLTLPLTNRMASTFPILGSMLVELVVLFVVLIIASSFFLVYALKILWSFYVRNASWKRMETVSGKIDRADDPVLILMDMTRSNAVGNAIVKRCTKRKSRLLSLSGEALDRNILDAVVREEKTRGGHDIRILHLLYGMPAEAISSLPQVPPDIQRKMDGLKSLPAGYRLAIATVMMLIGIVLLFTPSGSSAYPLFYAGMLLTASFCTAALYLAYSTVYTVHRVGKSLRVVIGGKKVKRTVIPELVSFKKIPLLNLTKITDLHCPVCGGTGSVNYKTPGGHLESNSDMSWVQDGPVVWAPGAQHWVSDGTMVERRKVCSGCEGTGKSARLTAAQEANRAIIDHNGIVTSVQRNLPRAVELFESMNQKIGVWNSKLKATG